MRASSEKIRLESKQLLLLTYTDNIHALLQSENPTMSPEVIAKFDAWIEKNIKELGLTEVREMLLGQSA